MYICALLITFACFVLFCVFVVGCGCSSPNEDIVRFRCGVEKSYTLLHIFFVKIF